MAAEAGILAVIADLTRTSAQFDASLGGFTASEGYTVYVAPADVPKLCKVLEETLTVDPLDPLCALSNAELRHILDTPLRTNLTEWALARKLLTTRGPDEDRPRTVEEKADWAQDVYAAADIRLARWLGAVVLISFGVAVVLVSMGMGGAFELAEAEFSARTPVGEQLSESRMYDRFAEPLKVLIPAVLCFASSLVLVFCWRLLPGGAWRWMFPPVWRSIGWWLLGLSAGGLLLGFLFRLFR